MAHRDFVHPLAMAHFREDLIVLDLEDNRFFIIPDISLERINAFLESNGISDPAISSALLDYGLLEKALIYRNRLVSYSNAGLLETRWTIPKVPCPSASGALLLKAILALGKANIILRFRGYAGVIQALSKRDDKGKECTEHSKIELVTLMAHINKIFILDCSRNRCLSYALTLCLMAKKIIPLRLVIGVRTRPFVSHAWIELEGKVVNDDPELRSKLAVILEL